MMSRPVFTIFNKAILLLALWAVAKNAQVVAGFIPAPGAYEYTETTGHDSRRFVWTLEEGGDWILTSGDERERHRAWLDRTLATRKWSLDRPAEKTAITAWREGTTLFIEGTRNGKEYRREYQVGAYPWYQALSLSLRNHLGEIGSTQEFWLIRPDNLELNRLQISKITVEPLRTATTVLTSYRVVIRLSGWKAPFWKGEYWFRRGDGQFVRYRGDSGPPGSPPTTVVPSGQVSVKIAD